ncbi:glycosyltransferase family 4 protein [Propionicimonas sp.]|uniref:glycosyltransferase family 4 protein n=1 Tax=Propionicimonas sp. TaxID=1955623 RepID=UPI0017D84F36|nr:glycosyltransferase family 4 protein [Propionicimonas sp.]MBU3978041.1 glycosyltransferase family 4 protein [Actinomycetota bacterium]MBA3021973.1 glycosyltransferase family 4 protein [Propionicimonas sp.]MBU3985517.1 glycosyltransferase family 4 protein [Actinomycetota bacterium]MBU4007680.1 glycosyltransferase family 4 protein [Actinomycetota bacterium]MBU4064455.1 glycosyltransferase family 4 protein [Actinomycetota bacterium]
MRITVIGINYLPEPTGIAPYTTGAVDGLAEAGEQLMVITGYPHYPQWRIAEGYQGTTRREVINGTRVLRLRHPVPTDGSVVGRSLMEVGFGLRACWSSWFNAEVVLAITPALLSTAAVVAKARLSRQPVVVWVQDIYTLSAAETGLAAKAAGLIRRVESWTLRHATRVIVIHDRFAAFVSGTLGVDPERIDVVRNWTHLAETGAIATAEVRASHGWAEEETVVLHAGNMGAKQNLESVVRASALAAARGSRVRFVLLGDGHRRNALEAMGGNANLQFIDPLPEAEFAAALASADVLLVNELPGMTEMSVPSKLTSYFNTGLPVLAAVDAGSVTAAEVAAAGGGLRVDPDEPAALLAAAEKLGSDAGLAGRLGAAGLLYRRETLAAPAAIRALRGSLHRATGAGR